LLGALEVCRPCLGQVEVQSGESIDTQVALRSIDVDMSSTSDERAPARDPRESRRWLIGIAISVFFGLFGVVMALLSYSERGKPSATGAGAAPRGAVEPAQQGRRKDRRRE
jgi:hypothetical protein